MFTAPLALAAALALSTVPDGRLEASAGLATSLYQSVFSWEASPVLEAAVEHRLRPAWTAAAGARVALGPTRPEGFLRLSAAPVLGRWRPAVGLELGVAGGDRFSEGDLLLREFRAAAEEDANPAYVAVHAAPLRFRFRDRLRLSVLEVQVGTQLGNFGRTVRLQLGLLSAGVAL
jgi:hypothetical protein